MTPHKDFFLHPRPSTPPPPQPPARTGPLQVFNPHAAGLDLGAAEHWVAVPPDRAPQPVRRFGTFPADLDVLADWLIDCGSTTVAMASTGVSKSANQGIQETPVDAMATVVLPQSMSQSAKTSRSAGKVPKRRTG